MEGAVILEEEEKKKKNVVTTQIGYTVPPKLFKKSAKPFPIFDDDVQLSNRQVHGRK